MNLKDYIRSIPDYPKKGILFRDITTLIKNEEAFSQSINLIIEKSKKSFDTRLQKIDWKTHYNSLPFNDSALALYEWAPIADELKILDRKIVLNSMILKWDNIKKEFEKLINI